MSYETHFHECERLKKAGLWIKKMSNRSRIIGVMEASIMKITLVLIMFQCVSATNHSVGGVYGWDPVSDMENWTSTTIFYTGDNLVFVYGPAHDVLEVDQNAFDICQKSSPSATHNDGNTVVSLDTPGLRYFICGTTGHCESGLKVHVDVLPLPGSSDDPNQGKTSPPPHPSPSAPSSPPLPSTHVPAFYPTVAPTPYKSWASKFLPHFMMDSVCSLLIMVVFV